jgi:replicative DNA helicase
MEHIINSVRKCYVEIDYKSKHKNELMGCSTGFRDLDFITDGLHSSDLIVIGSRPSMGKTTFALNIALNVSVRNKIPVAIFSLEMSKEQLAQRIMCSEVEVPIQKIRRGNLQRKDWDKIADAMEKIENAPIYIDDTSITSLVDIKAKCCHLKKEIENLGLIIIDYFQLIEKNNEERISKRLKTLAKELQVPIIVLSQLSRRIEKRNPHLPALSDLKDSGLEEDADVVMLIYRDDYYNLTEDLFDNRAGIIVAKNKNGEVGLFQLVFRNDIPKFENTINTEFF